jgi:hypothetical protein
VVAFSKVQITAALIERLLGTMLGIEVILSVDGCSAKGGLEKIECGRDCGNSKQLQEQAHHHQNKHVNR